MLSPAQKLLRKSKQSERDLGHWLIENDGIDPLMIGIASTALRVGHIHSLRYDLHSMTYAAENKRVRLNKTYATWWTQIIRIAKERGKEALLSIEPSNTDPKIPRMHIITSERHASLLQAERFAREHGYGKTNQLPSSGVDLDDSSLPVDWVLDGDGASDDNVRMVEQHTLLSGD